MDHVTKVSKKKVEKKRSRGTATIKKVKGLKSVVLGRQPDGTMVYISKVGALIHKTAEGRFIKGSPGAGVGISKAARTRLTIKDLLIALEHVEAKQKLSLLEHFVTRAYKDDPVLVALMKKLLPDLKSVEQFTVGGTVEMDEQTAHDVQEEFRQRFVISLPPSTETTEALQKQEGTHVSP